MTTVWYPLAIIFSILLCTTIILSLYVLFRSSARFQRLLDKMASLAHIEHIDSLKDHYLKLYHLYCKMPDHHKAKYYERFTKLRSTLEEKMHSEHKLHRLLEKDHPQDVDEQKKHLAQIQEHYEKLPTKVKKRYLGHVVQARQKMERV